MINMIKDLVSICKKSQEELKSWLLSQMLKYYTRKNIKLTDNYLYVKGTLPVCLVAHLDTVHFNEPTEFLFDPVLNNLFSPTGIGGDDRCGVYIILELLKRGFRPSIIFCCDEEIGAIGASEFTKVYNKIKNVNWFLEFDRRGRNDVVCYDDGNEELTKVFESFGFKSSWGSFSDISELAPFYGISAVNISSGYYNAHTKNEYINLDDLQWIIDRAEEVLNSEYVYTMYFYIESYPSYINYRTYQNGAWNDLYDYPDSNDDSCDMCGCACDTFDLEKTEIGYLCKKCIDYYELVWCDECKQYVVPNEKNSCDVCGNYLGDKDV